MPEVSPKLRPVFSLRVLLGMVLVAAAVSFFAAYLRNHQRTYRAAAQLQHVQMVGLALLNYDSMYRTFPPSSFLNASDQPNCSWRPKILPFYESGRLYFKDAHPWNAPANAQLGRECKVAFVWDLFPAPGCELHTNLLGITGPDAAFQPSRPSRITSDESARDLILLIEVRNSGLHWMEPGDLDYRELVERERAGKLTLGVMDGSFCVCFVDGRVWRLRSDTPRDLLLNFMTVEGAREHDAEELLGPYRK